MFERIKTFCLDAVKNAKASLTSLKTRFKNLFAKDKPTATEAENESYSIVVMETAKDDSPEFELFKTAVEVSKEVGPNLTVNSLVTELAILVNHRSTEDKRDPSFVFDYNKDDVRKDDAIIFLDNMMSGYLPPSKASFSTVYEMSKHIELYKSALKLFLYGKTTTPALDESRKIEREFIVDYLKNPSGS